MSNSSEVSGGRIHVRSAGPVRITLLDGRLQLVGVPAVGEFLKEDAPPGLYLLQYDTGWVSQEVPFRLEKGKNYEDLNVSVPFPSAAPIPGTSGYRPLQAKAAREMSENPRGLQDRTLGAGARLMVFVRSLKDGAKAPLLAALSLLDRNLKPLVDPLPSDRSSDREGWVGWCADVEPGFHVLRWKSEEASQPAVDQALWAAAGWTTILFLTSQDDGKAPHPQDLTVHMARIGTGFLPEENPADAADLVSTHLAMELALAGWRTGKALVDSSSLNRLLESKFANPMLGVVAAHVLLEGSKPDEDFLRKLLQTLESPSLLAHCPDIRALRGMVRRRFKSTEPVSLLDWPPVFKASFKGAIAGDWDGHGLISSGSLADRAAPRLVALSPWTTWLCLTDAVSSVQAPRTDDSDAEAKFLGDWLSNVFSELAPTERILRQLGFDWKQTTPENLWRLVLASPDPTLGKLAAQVQAMYRFAHQQGDLKGIGEWNLAGVARSLNLPRASVTSAAIRLAQGLATSPSIAEMEARSAADEAAWPPANGPRFIRGEAFGDMLLETAEQLASRYPDKDFTDGVAQVFAWFDGKLKRNRRFINGRRFATVDAFRAYLRKAVLNAARMAARTRRKGEAVAAVSTDQSLASRPAADPSPAQLASWHEAVEKLLEPHRTILQKLFFEQMDIGQVAEQLTLPRAMVERLYDEGIDRLPLE